MRRRSSLLVVVALSLAVAAPAAAQHRDRKSSKASTVVKWTLIGAGIGAAAGFSIGFRAFDDATYADRKITQAMFGGAAIGEVGGWAIGHSRAASARAPVAASLWTPSTPMKRSPNDQRYKTAR